jgi:hypothetical protein
VNLFGDMLSGSEGDIDVTDAQTPTADYGEIEFELNEQVGGWEQGYLIAVG